MKWMDFGLVLRWTLKLFRGFFLIFKYNNEIKIEGLDSYLMEFMSYGLLFGEKQTHFSKVHYILKKKMLKFNKNVLINDLYKGKKN
jgi:hypothetical protein